MKNQTTTYSRMFLVAPTVYEKLLSCIDEKDRKVTQELNISKENIQRPSDEYIQDLNNQSFIEQPEEGEEEENQIPAMLQEENIGPPIYQPQNVMDEFVPDTIYNEGLVEPIQPAMQQTIVRNVLPINGNTLKTPCNQQSTDENDERVIPQGGLIYRPNSGKKQQKFMSNIKTIKVTGSKFKPNNKIRITIPENVPAIKDRLIAPQIINQTKQLQTLENKTKTHQCKVCLKFYPGKWNLKRHMDTVHKNIKSLKAPIPTTNFQVPVNRNRQLSVQALPDTDSTMSDFQSWNKNKRTATDAKLREPNTRKFRPPGGEGDDNFESWQ
jgi:hypothetical protein